MNKDFELNTDFESKQPETGNNTSGADECDFVLGSDFVIDTSHETKELKPSRKKKNKRRKGPIVVILWVVGIVVVSVALAYALIMGFSDYLGIGNGDICTVEISQGMSTKQIAETLHDSGAIKMPFLFRVYSRLKGHDGTFKYGIYEFSNDIGYEGIVEKLQTEGAHAETVTVRIPEMATINEIAEILEQAGVCTKSEFLNACRKYKTTDLPKRMNYLNEIPIELVRYRFEGYLFPDTYQFYKDENKDCATLAIEKMLKNLDNKLSDELMQRAQETNRTVHEILTMASIIELEASSHPEEMCNVSAVFYNRLAWTDEPNLLGSSPTMYYPSKENPDKRYDTNITPGLPPGPLCAPSLNAIKAALYPTEGFKYTYFVTDSQMKFYYNTSIQDHYSTINSLKAQGKWLG